MGCRPKIGKRLTKKLRISVTSTVGGTSPKSTTLVIPRVPQDCSNCGGKTEATSVKWIGPSSIECSYCGAILPVEFEKIA